MNLEDKITIFVCSCDSYEDLWYPFFFFLDKYWPNNKLQIVLNTETKSYVYKDLKIISYPQSKSEKYGERMIRNLKNISTDYTLLLLDDFFLRSEVDINCIKKHVEIMDNDSYVNVIYYTKQILNQVEAYTKGLAKLKDHAMYKLNMQAGLWRTDRLLELWEPIDNPWKWEIFANYSTFKSNYIYLEIEDAKASPFEYGYNKDGMGVFRGKWVYDDVNPLFEENGIHIDYSVRGIYKKENEVQRFGNGLELFVYMFRRMPIRYIISFVVFYGYKKISLALGKKIRYETHSEYLLRNR